MSTQAPLSVGSEVIDKAKGYFTQIQNIVFVLELSAPAERAYIRLKWHAGGDLKKLPRQERRLAKLLGISRSAFNRVWKELSVMGLVVFTDDATILTDLQLVNAKYFQGKVRLQKAREEIKKIAEIEAKHVELGPISGQNLGPKSGQKAGPKSGHMINNMKNKNMCSPISSQVPTNANAKSAIDDIEKTSVSDSSDAKKLADVIVWFEELSGGTRWQWSRDGKAFDLVKHCPTPFLMFGVAVAVLRTPSHVLGSFKPCAAVVVEYADSDMSRMADSDLMDLAKRERRKVLACRKSGKWSTDKMTDDDWREYKRAVNER